MSDWYTLEDDGKTPVRIPDGLGSADERQRFKDGVDRDRHPGWIVDKTEVGDCEVSTVFLFLDHGYNDPMPILWETLVLGAPTGHPLDQECERYATWDEARAGHDAMVQRVKDCPWLTLNAVIAGIKALNKGEDTDWESAHAEADNLLLRHLNDPELTEAFRAVARWYA